MASLLALISSILWGSADFEGGRLSKKHAPIAVLGLSQIIGLIFGLSLLIFFGTSGAHAFGSNGYLIPGICAGFLGYFGLMCLYSGLASGRMGVVSPISSLSAVIPLSYALWRGERLSITTSIGVVLALGSAFFTSGPEISQGFSIRPLLLALGAAFGFGTALTFIAIGSQSSALMTMVTMRAATVGLTIAIAIRFRNTGGFTKNEYPRLAFMGISDFLANLLLGIACNSGSISVAMVLGSLYPVATALLAYKYLHERLRALQYVGVTMAVIGVALISAF